MFNRREVLYHTRCILGILIPFLGSSLGAGCVLLKNSLRDGIQRALTGLCGRSDGGGIGMESADPGYGAGCRSGQAGVFPAAVGFWLGILFLLLLDHLIPHLHQNSLQATGPSQLNAPR